MITKISRTTTADGQDDEQTQSRTRRAANWLAQMALSAALLHYAIIPAIDFVFDELLEDNTDA